MKIAPACIPSTAKTRKPRCKGLDLLMATCQNRGLRRRLSYEPLQDPDGAPSCAEPGFRRTRNGSRTPRVRPRETTREARPIRQESTRRSERRRGRVYEPARRKERRLGAPCRTRRERGADRLNQFSLAVRLAEHPGEPNSLVARHIRPRSISCHADERDCHAEASHHLARLDAADAVHPHVGHDRIKRHAVLLSGLQLDAVGLREPGIELRARNQVRPNFVAIAGDVRLHTDLSEAPTRDAPIDQIVVDDQDGQPRREKRAQKRLRARLWRYDGRLDEGKQEGERGRVRVCVLRQADVTAHSPRNRARDWQSQASAPDSRVGSRLVVRPLVVGHVVADILSGGRRARGAVRLAERRHEWLKERHGIRASQAVARVHNVDTDEVDATLWGVHREFDDNLPFGGALDRVGHSVGDDLLHAQRIHAHARGNLVGDDGSKRHRRA
mmetsp:Transcript_3516/g.12787  ORF Transcript_3516/g.12787 Transcript_3516/m.12787 type:complete len:442 (+) Transcript_3516:34-1359(+)